MSYAKIDYGFGKARFWGSFDRKNVEKQFYRHANQCFGIRKSIMKFDLLEFNEAEDIPKPWTRFEDAVVVLEHSGDTIVWDAQGQKIKSEWD